MVVPNMLAFQSNLESVFYIVLRTRALAHRFFTFTPNLANPPPPGQLPDWIATNFGDLSQASNIVFLYGELDPAAFSGHW